MPIRAPVEEARSVAASPPSTIRMDDTDHMVHQAAEAALARRQARGEASRLLEEALSRSKPARSKANGGAVERRGRWPLVVAAVATGSVLLAFLVVGIYRALEASPPPSAPASGDPAVHHPASGDPAGTPASGAQTPPADLSALASSAPAAADADEARGAAGAIPDPTPASTPARPPPAPRPVAAPPAPNPWPKPAPKPTAAPKPAAKDLPPLPFP